MSIQIFQDDDRGYLDWVAENPDGYVLDIRRGFDTSDAELHRASCRDISGENPRRESWTGPYIKLCSPDVAAFDQFAAVRARVPIDRCLACLLANPPPRESESKSTDPPSNADRVSPS